MRALLDTGLTLAAACGLCIDYAAAVAVQSGQQQPLGLERTTAKPHKLHGRFLHITDFHPDPHYLAHASTGADSACHRGHGSAGYYGAETSDCDSPFTLVNATFDWIAANLKNEIDFVIWTGDSARHDNDEDFPRSSVQVRELNRYMVSKFDEVFGRERDDNDPYDLYTVPIVPTLGNNDILPHNIFDIGPNDWTRAYLDIWRHIIPEQERHEFDQSGWFAIDVIPGYLTAFSLNTLYFFDKNAAVDGCSTKGEPGYRQFEWLRIQLQFLRERGQKAILVGHVPPARTEGKMNWDETCWQKYALWMRQYRDVIVGSFYGHMNVDHFILQDFEQVDPDLDKGYGIEDISSSKDLFSIKSAASYMSEMRAAWASLPKKPKGVKSNAVEVDVSSAEEATSDERFFGLSLGAFKSSKKKKDDQARKEKKEKQARKYLDSIGGDHAERFALSFVSPSVVPNFFPTLRIIEYNTTGVDYRSPTLAMQRPKVNYEVDSDVDQDDDESDVLEDYDEEDLNALKKSKKDKKKDKEKKKQKKLRKRRKFTIPEGPSKSAPPGPAYSPQSLTFLGYQQYFANLTYINNDFDSGDDDDASIQGGKWKDGKHKGKKGDQDKGPLPRNFTYEPFYDTQADKVYKLKDLTVRSYVELAARMASGIDAASDMQEDEVFGPDETEALGKKKINPVWYTFIERAFVGTKSDQEIRQDFGN